MSPACRLKEQSPDWKLAVNKVWSYGLSKRSRTSSGSGFLPGKRSPYGIPQFQWWYYGVASVTHQWNMTIAPCHVSLTGRDFWEDRDRPLDWLSGPLEQMFLVGSGAWLHKNSNVILWTGRPNCAIPHLSNNCICIMTCLNSSYRHKDDIPPLIPLKIYITIPFPTPYFYNQREVQTVEQW